MAYTLPTRHKKQNNKDINNNIDVETAAAQASSTKGACQPEERRPQIICFKIV